MPTSPKFNRAEPVSGHEVALSSMDQAATPAVITAAGKNAAFAYAEFFGADIENPNT